jgi:hypothetical protein
VFELYTTVDFRAWCLVICEDGAKLLVEMDWRCVVDVDGPVQDRCVSVLHRQSSPTYTHAANSRVPLRVLHPQLRRHKLST